MNFSIHQASHIGHRRFNQDRVAYAYSNDALLLVLADGMGGHMHGELAANLAVETFVETFGLHAQPRISDPDAFIPDTMRYAHERIMRVPHDEEMGGFPGTTCVAMLVQDGKMYWGHAGDSRLYLLRDGAVYTRTSDHSMVQRMVDAGMITAEQARVHTQRNQITNCLGGVSDLFYVECGKPIALKSGDVVLLGSDGLWGPFTDRELVESFFALPVPEVLDQLVQRALKLEEGHSDNITGVAVRWGEGESAHHTDQPVSHVLEIS
ncbi:MAG: serine/threonine-protein phosphatase [Nitrosomonadales bacterium]|nr:serine/threonine-protein phosphatase [Nitrosomonadales bacterium]